MALPVSSQVRKFETHPQDARLIFHQDFEAPEGLTPQQAYDVWAQTPIDTIHELEYYSRVGTGSISSGTDIYGGSADWEIFAVRTDSTSSEWTQTKPGDGIVMFNGADPTSSETEIKNNVYGNDSWYIVNDKGEDVNRVNAFKQYGEDGGESFFQWKTGDIYAARQAGKISSSHYSTDTRSVKKYRRDLYVRDLDIEDESSYRLTFYVKVNKVKESVSWGPKLYADVMRGYHHQRQAFSMGYKSGKNYALEMNPEDFELGKWQKVTMMTYYINAHEADGYVMYSGEYSWDDDWTWRPSDEELQALGKTLDEGDSLRYIKQPDKFFVRLSMCTDSMEYSLDNLSLTKSWIAGAEYYNDMLRIDFGYDTNLKDLVAAEKAKTNIPVVQVPFDMDKYYFEVWGLLKGGDPENTGDPNDPNDTGDWEEVYIRSAEYHEDGFMYMFTEYDALDQPIVFADKYDKVYVTFRNPVDKPELTLKYTGSYYPKPLDEDWVKNGKIVPDFYNELATPNMYSFIGVKPIEGLPPIMMKAPYEEGAFGLDGNTTELRFKFTREVKIDDYNAEGNNDFIVAKVGNEFWERSWDANNSELVLTRPNSYRANPLKGDQEIKIMQIVDKTNGVGEDVTLHYHFGDFDPNPQEPTKLYGSDWRNELGSNKNTNECVPASTWIRDCNSSSSPVFSRGTNGPVDDIVVNSKNAKCCLFLLNYDVNNLDACAYYISSRQSNVKYTGHMWTIVDFAAAGDYVIKFKASSYISTKTLTNLLFYPKPDGDEASFTFDTFNGVTGKDTLREDLQPEQVVLKADIKAGTAVWPVGTEVYECEFNVPAAGKYVFEWVSRNCSSSGDGVLIGNFSISNKASNDLSVKYVKKLLSAVADAQAKLDATTATKYKGAAYNALATAKTEAAAYVGNFPSKYDSVVAHVNECLIALNENIATVDLFYNTIEDVKAKLASFNNTDSVKYKDLISYKALETHVADTLTWKCEEKTNAQIETEIESYEADMKAIDDRMDLIAKFAAKLEDIKAYKDAKDKRADFDEYAAMVTAYNTGVTAQAVITNSDADYKASYDAFIEAKNGYVFKFDYIMAKTKQIKDLYALAVDTLGYDFASIGGNDSVKNVINALLDEHAPLSSVLREAAILQILKIYKENDPAKVAKLKDLDVSALIPNYYLYNEAQAGRDLEKNSSGQWYLKKGTTNKTAIPGWTVKTSSSSQYDMKWYFTTAKDTGTYAVDSYVDWEVDGHVFIGGLRTAIRTQGSLSTEIQGLPHAYYLVGVNCYNNSSDLYYDFKSVKDTTYRDKIINLNAGQKNTTFMDLCVDSVLVYENLSYKIDQQSTSSGEVDIRRAVLRLSAPDDQFNYSDAVIAAQQSKLTEAITLVDAPVQEVGVEYYTLGGIKINAPKSGEILIRKTSRGGKIIVDKVLIK